MDKQFIITLLDHSFFEDVKQYVNKTILPDRADEIYELLVLAHDKYQRDITLDDLLVLHEIQNPVAPQTKKIAFRLLVDAFRNVEPLGKDIAKDYVFELYRQEKAKLIADHALQIAQGNASSKSFGEIRTLLGHIDNQSDVLDEYNIVNNDVDYLLAEDAKRSKYVFNIPELARLVGGPGPGELTIIFARPETGKTASWVSLAYAPGGWIEQGASVHAIINEEPARRTMLRAVSSYTGMRKEHFRENLDVVKAQWAQVRDRTCFIDSVDFSIEMLDAYVKKHSPDFTIVDQLDKIHIDGSFARTDERLKAIYVYAREIAKRRNTSLIAICQASADAEGKSILDMSMMENSKTGKAAEADLVIGIGKTPMSADGLDNPVRTWNVLKNKITGWHGPIHCQLDGYLSRYTQ